MYLGGNGFYWRIAHSERHPGVLEVRRGEEGTRLWTSSAGEHHHSFTGELGGTWRRLGRAPNRLAGVGFVAQGFDSAALYRRTAGSRDPRAKFIFDGIEAEFFGHGGLVGDGAAGLEIDSSNQSLGTPEHALVVAQSFGHSNAYVLSLDELEVNLSGADGTVDPRVRAEMVFFEAGKGGAVFSTGSIAYVGALTAHGGDNPLSRLTRNVVTRFLDSTPFVVPMVAADAARSGTPASVVADWAPGSGAGQPQKRKADG
jgi:N,N-dimethylformamidase